MTGIISQSAETVSSEKAKADPNESVSGPVHTWHKVEIIDQVGVEERVAKLNKRSIKKESKMSALKLSLSMVDLTTLEGCDTKGKVEQLCNKAKNPHPAMPNLPTPAAICVYPTHVATAVKALEGSGIHVASVSTAFPSGNAPMNIKIDDTKFAVDAGASEIDMVISRGDFFRGEFTKVFDEIALIKETCGKAHLKVILETGELFNYENVRLASDIAMEAGADFIKTSTGKIGIAATQPVTLVMLQAIKDFYDRTGRKVGMKPAGGIKNSKQAIQYLILVKETLGNDWLTPDLFRFGASSLANDLLMQIVKQVNGNYQSLDYFSID